MRPLMSRAYELRACSMGEISGESAIILKLPGKTPVLPFAHAVPVFSADL